MQREVVIVSGVRTAIGSFGGSLKDLAPTELAAQVTREALVRAEVSTDEIGHVVFGHVINTEPKDMYLARVAAIQAGIAESTPALTLNRLCGSGLQAIITAAQAILLGDADIAIGAGAENMSRAPYADLTARWGARMGDAKLVDMMVGALHDPFHDIHMGVTAENVAAKWGITREDQDRLAVASHNRAERATANGYFRDQIVPVTLKSKKGDTQFAADEHFRTGAKLEDMPSSGRCS
jgi:acetyl-CoA C-acetyltransferase